MSSLSALAFGRFLLLGADADLLQSNTSLLFESSLMPVFELLQLAGSHVYISKSQVHRALLLLTNITAILQQHSGKISIIWNINKFSFAV